MDIKKDHINFAVGPVQISEEISRIGADPVPYFRTPDFSALMKENEALLKEFMDAPEDARAVFLTGSGTASMDAVTQNVFTKDDRLLVVAGGSFGHRFCEICEVYGIPHTAIELRQGHALTPADLAPYAGQGYTGFLVNMHETSTGVLYDMDMISAFCRENGLVLVVDAISAFLADVSDSLSYAVTPLSPNNPEVSAHQLFLTLKDEYGIIICPNGGELADKVFRVGHIGHLTVEDNDALFRAFDDLMARGILKA